MAGNAISDNELDGLVLEDSGVLRYLKVGAGTGYTLAVSVGDDGLQRNCRAGVGV